MKATMRGVFLAVIGVAIVILPAVCIRVGAPSAGEFVTRTTLLGDLKTASGTTVELHGVWGDVFNPRASRSDLGYDLAVVSLYFDPLAQTTQHIVIAGNPLLSSAISRSLATPEELSYLLSNLVRALDESKRAVICFMNKPLATGCEGDQIVPYIWPVLPGSELSTNRVKYLAAAPLFDPNILITNAGETAPTEVRERLADNVRAVVQRLLGRAAVDLDHSVASIAFAALGSTSHRGGDSPYFLPFSDGFSEIVSGVEKSRPNSSLTRVYLVAFDQHTGAFKAEALSALRHVALRCRAKALATDNGVIAGGAIALLFFLLGAVAYRGTAQDRWEFVGTVLGVASVPGAVAWGAAVALAQASEDYQFHLEVTYGVLAVSAILFIHWLGRRSGT